MTCRNHFIESFLNVNCTEKRSPGEDGVAVLRSELNTLLYVMTAVRAISHSTYTFIIDYGALTLLCVAFGVLIYFTYKAYWDPICYKKEMTEVGFDHIPSGRYRKQKIARAQNNRQTGDNVPPPYPNGWFAIAESRDLLLGGVMTVNALGQNLCVYRGEDGIARVVDAYCPHLGANLGIGGSVCDSNIVCPFHQWTFNSQGACVSRPGGDVPNGVSIKTWTCVEADGAVWFWHDADDRAPLWRLRNAPECKKWGYRGRNEYVVNTHIQDIPENGADLGHLNVVHSPSMILSTLVEKYPFLHKVIGHHIWSGSWQANSDHTARMILTHDYTLLNHQLFHIELQITQTGPGHVRLRMETPFGPYLLSQSVTPIGPMLQKVVHRVYSPMYNALAASILIISEGKMIERDIKIWNSKRFVSAPKYLKGDKTIREYRNWYSQFYTEHSVSFKESLSTQNLLDW